MVLSFMRARLIFILGVNLILWAGIFSSAAALEIKVKEQATASGDRITLGDVASFNPIQDNRIDRLRDIEIGSAPVPGAHYRINDELLLYRIGPFVATEEDIRMKVPETLLVYRSAQVIDSARMAKIFEQYVIDNSPWPKEKLVFERISTPKRILLPEGRLRWEAREKLNRDFVGNIALALDFYVDEKKIRSVHISGRINLVRDLVEAAAGIEAGHVLTANDIVLRTEHEPKFRKNAITDIAEAIGKRAIRNIRAGQVILANMIETPPLVKKGNRVLIKAENELIRITTLGKVLEDGASGDQVRVMNVNSGKEIFATVTGPDVVEVQF